MTTTTLQGLRSADQVGDALLTDLVVAIETEVDLEAYLAFRDAGATHDQALAADALAVWPADYAAARRQGLTHRQTLSLWELMGDLKLPLTWIDEIVSLTQLTAVLRAQAARDDNGVVNHLRGGFMSDSLRRHRTRVAADYVNLRDAGFSHRAACAFLAQSLDAEDYFKLRSAGLTHRVALRSTKTRFRLD